MSKSNQYVHSFYDANASINFALRLIISSLVAPPLVSFPENFTVAGHESGFFV